MRGHGAPPLWVEDLRLAEDWGIPPWKIDEEAPDIWVQRWEAWQEAISSKTPTPKGEGWLLP